ncbi:MAG: adenylate/guanylate cyclase domain-containing protein [Chloroflexi bacterium]|nr:adenylate/guanylate cyclase domain-containing protein [Chloroflexota bacterium]
MLNFLKRQPDYKAATANLTKHNVEAALSGRFTAWLEAAADHELFHVNPRYLADKLSLDERATLKLLVAALYEGVVAMHWDVRCPVCGMRNNNDSLGDLKHEMQCSMCHARFAPHFDEEVRVTFSLHARLRALPPAADDKAFREEIDTRYGPTLGQSLLLLPDFQRLFPQERLLPDESLEVSRAALLFTDLAGSTALYAARGDPRAYHLVRLHFDELFAVADKHGGTVVKNIGDAIMAAFQTPAEALRAALDMQTAIAALNQRERLTSDEALILKVGLHSGPCLSVTLNDRPDYFGTTVNIAARVQGISHGGDVVFTDAVRDDAEAQKLLAGKTLESDCVTVKGIEGEIAVHRLGRVGADS